MPHTLQQQYRWQATLIHPVHIHIFNKLLQWKYLDKLTADVNELNKKNLSDMHVIDDGMFRQNQTIC